MFDGLEGSEVQYGELDFLSPIGSAFTLAGDYKSYEEATVLKEIGRLRNEGKILIESRPLGNKRFAIFAVFLLTNRS